MFPRSDDGRRWRGKALVNREDKTGKRPRQTTTVSVGDERFSTTTDDDDDGLVGDALQRTAVSRTRSTTAIRNPGKARNLPSPSIPPHAHYLCSTLFPPPQPCPMLLPPSSAPVVHRFGFFADHILFRVTFVHGYNVRTWNECFSGRTDLNPLPFLPAFLPLKKINRDETRLTVISRRP